MTARRVATVKGLRALCEDESGASLVVVGLALPVVIGAMGLAAEISYWQLHHRAMQNASGFCRYRCRNQRPIQLCRRG
jgi:Flp pilus assembly protein TadG